MISSFLSHNFAPMHSELSDDAYRQTFVSKFGIEIVVPSNIRSSYAFSSVFSVCVKLKELF